MLVYQRVFIILVNYPDDASPSIPDDLRKWFAEFTMETPTFMRSHFDDFIDDGPTAEFP